MTVMLKKKKIKICFTCRNISFISAIVCNGVIVPLPEKSNYIFEPVRVFIRLLVHYFDSSIIENNVDFCDISITRSPRHDREADEGKS